MVSWHASECIVWLSNLAALYVAALDLKLAPNALTFAGKCMPRLRKLAAHHVTLHSTSAAHSADKVAGECMARLSKLAARYIGEYGLSMGLVDVTPVAALQREKASVLANNYAVVHGLVRDFRAGALETLPGCDEDASLEVWCLSPLGCRKLSEHILDTVSSHRVHGYKQNAAVLTRLVCQQVRFLWNALAF